MIRVLTLNIHKGFTAFNSRFMLHELREAIRSSGADIVFLQEVQGEHSEKEARHEEWPNAAQYEFLADEVWHEYAYGKNAVYTEGHHGNAILSKYPIASWNRMDISTNRIEQRGHLHCRVEMPNDGCVLHCICIHLGLTAVSRRKQLDMIAGYVNTNVGQNEPLIIAGDTNDWTGVPARGFARHLGMEIVRGRTFPARMPLLHLDRIFVRGLSVTAARTNSEPVWRELSDHIPISADLELETPEVSR